MQKKYKIFNLSWKLFLKFLVFSISSNTLAQYSILIILIFNYILCYTDGSLINPKTDVAYSVQNFIFIIKLLDIFSVSSSELIAILSCLENILYQPKCNSTNLIIFDSQSSFQVIQNIYSTSFFPFTCLYLILTKYPFFISLAI